MNRPGFPDLHLEPFIELLLEAPTVHFAPGPVLPRVDDPPQSPVHGFPKQSVEDALLPGIFGPLGLHGGHGLEHAPAGLHEASGPLLRDTINSEAPPVLQTSFQHNLGAGSAWFVPLGHLEDVALYHSLDQF